MASLAPFLIAVASLPLLAAPQQSLGDLARQLRQQQIKSGSKATKVYTNDNLPGLKPDDGRDAASIPSGAPAATAPAQTQTQAEAPQAAAMATPPAEQAQGALPALHAKSESDSKEHWQARFHVARAKLADAREQQQLAEDELSLLQTQDARTLDSRVKADLAGRISAKQDEVSQKRAATEEAQKALDDLQRQFEASGDPEEWNEEPEGGIP